MLEDGIRYRKERSIFTGVTLNPRFASSLSIQAVEIPLPTAETTPPVTNIYLIFFAITHFVIGVE